MDDVLQWPHSVAPRAVDQLGRAVPHMHMHPGHPQLGRHVPFGAPTHPEQWPGGLPYRTLGFRDQAPQVMHPHFNGVMPVRMVQRVDHHQLRILQSMQEQEMQVQLARIQHASVQARQEASSPTPGNQDRNTSGNSIEATPSQSLHQQQAQDQKQDRDQDDSASSQSTDREDTVYTANFGTSSNVEDVSDGESALKVDPAQSAASSTSLGQTFSQNTSFTAASSTHEAAPSSPERRTLGERPSPSAASSNRAASSHEAPPERWEVPRILSLPSALGYILQSSAHIIYHTHMKSPRSTLPSLPCERPEAEWRTSTCDPPLTTSLHL